jgi:predicted metalloprotease
MSDHTENDAQPVQPAAAPTEPDAAPVQPGAAPAGPAGAPQPPATSSNRTLWVVVIVIVVSLLCFCGVTGGLILAGSLLDDEAQDSTGGTEQETPATREDAEEAAEDTPATLDQVRAEAERSWRSIRTASSSPSPR